MTDIPAYEHLKGRISAHKEAQKMSWREAVYPPIGDWPGDDLERMKKFAAERGKELPVRNKPDVEDAKATEFAARYKNSYRVDLLVAYPKGIPGFDRGSWTKLSDDKLVVIETKRTGFSDDVSVNETPIEEFISMERARLGIYDSNHSSGPKL